MSTSRSPETNTPDTSAQEALPMQPPSPREQERLGDILRRVREHRGESIKEIAQYLCIRSGYLIALEESRYERLPADAYVIGFLKSYATYLELDGKGAVDQYRREMAGRRRKPQLSMPQPMSEGRAPTIALLIGGTLAVLLVYGIWYGLWAPDRSVTEAPVAIPTSITEESTSVEEPKIEDSSVFLETATMPKVTEIDPIIIEAETKAKLAAPVEEKVENITIKQKSAALKSEPSAIKVEAPAPKPESLIVQEELPPLKTEAPADKPEKKETPVVKTETPTTQIFGAKDKFNVSVKAESDSWILITDEKGLTVFDRTLKAGEVYNIPPQKGLRLTTGNPTGVSLKLNGVVLPKLQSTEKVARGIPLDPSKLKSLLSEQQEKEND